MFLGACGFLYYKISQPPALKTPEGPADPGFTPSPGNAPLAIEEAHIELETVAVHPDTGVPLVLEC